MISVSQGVFALACYLLVGLLISAKIPYHEMRDTMARQAEWVKPRTWTWAIAAYFVGLAVAWPLLLVAMLHAKRDAKALPRCPACGGAQYSAPVSGGKIDAEFHDHHQPICPAPDAPAGLRFHGSWEFAKSILDDPRYRARRDAWPEGDYIYRFGSVYRSGVSLSRWVPTDYDATSTDWTVWLPAESAA